MEPKKKTQRAARPAKRAKKRVAKAAVQAADETAQLLGVIDQAKRASFEALLGKLKAGKKLTAADYKHMRELEEELRKRKGGRVEASEPTLGATVEEDLEEWVVRDGVVRGHERRLSELARTHQVERGELDRRLCAVQRELLKRYGFEGTKRSGDLSGVERQGLQWVKSIEQLARISREWELQMEGLRELRAEGLKVIDMESFATLVDTIKKVASQRDTLVLKVRELNAKERRVGTGRGQKAMSFQVVVNNGPI